MARAPSDVAGTGAGAGSFVQVPPSNPRNHHGRLLFTWESADVTFKVGGGGAMTIPAHRCILAARSTVFRAMLSGNMTTTTTTARAVVHIKDMGAPIFLILLYFIYTDEVPELDWSKAMEEESGHGVSSEAELQRGFWQDLLVAAKRYNLPRLRLICEEKLCDQCVSKSTVMALLDWAEEQQCRGLKAACLHFLKVIISQHDS